MLLDNSKLKRIHVNQHNIKHNGKTGEAKPVITVKCGGKTYIGNDVYIFGESKVVYSPCKPMSCGAKVWIETNAHVRIGGQDECGPCQLSSVVKHV
jgi:hypothetical protein